jgi:hypothetical protein
MTDAAVIQQRHMGPRSEIGVMSGKQVALGQTHELEVVKRAVRISIGLGKATGHCGGNRSPPKRKKRRQKHSPQKR